MNKLLENYKAIQTKIFKDLEVCLLENHIKISFNNFFILA